MFDFIYSCSYFASLGGGDMLVRWHVLSILTDYCKINRVRIFTTMRCPGGWVGLDQWVEGLRPLVGGWVAGLG